MIMKTRSLLAIGSVLGLASLANAQTYPGGGFAIPDNNTTGGSSSIVIADPGLVGTGMIAAMTFSPEHTWVGDIAATLSHFDGTTTATVDLFRRPGKLVATTGFGFSTDMNGLYRFSDAFTGNLWTAAAVGVGGNVPAGDYRSSTNLFGGTAAGTAGSYAPTSLDAIFAGRTLAGTWTLKIVDGAPPDFGSISGWSITVPGPGAIALVGLAGLIGKPRRRR